MEPSASDARRVHGSAVVLWMLDELKQLVFAFIPLILGRARFNIGIPISLGIVAAVAVVAVVRYVRFSYTITPDSLVIEGGALFRYRRVLPRARVQSIDLVQKLRHQMLGVVEVRVEVIGGGKTEGRLIAVAAQEAERVRAELLDKTGQVAAEPAAPATQLVKLGLRDLFLAGLTGGRVAVLALLLGFFDDLLPEDLERWLDPDRLQIPAAVFVVGAVLAVLLVTLIVSLVVTIFVYWDFTVTREDDRLVITRGLLEKRRAVVPIRRIQAFRVHENIVHRPLGLASVTVRVAGYGGPGEEVRESSMLLPVGKREAALALVSGLLPSPLAVEQVPLVPAPRRALRRRVVRALLLAGVAGVGGRLRWGSGGWLVLMLAAPFAWIAWLSWRALGHAMEGGYVLARSGWLVRTTSVVRSLNVQVCERLSSPFQRLADLASLKLRIPKGSVEIVDVEAERADQRFREIVAAMG